jgi:hypothetical protein
MSDEYPVTIAARRPDGTVEQVRVGTATKSGDGFLVRLNELTIGQAHAVPGGRGAAERGPARPPGGPAGLPTVLPNYGRSKGMPIAGASVQDLEFYANGARRTLADPSKSRFHEKERLLLAAIDTELARQGHGSAEGAEEPPIPSDSDMPPEE